MAEYWKRIITTIKIDASHEGISQDFVIVLRVIFTPDCMS